MSVPIETHAVARAHGRGVASVQRLAIVSLVAAQNGSVGCYHIASSFTATCSACKGLIQVLDTNRLWIQGVFLNAEWVEYSIED